MRKTIRTISARTPEPIVRSARRLARKRGTTLSGLLRDLLAREVDAASAAKGGRERGVA